MNFTDELIAQSLANQNGCSSGKISDINNEVRLYPLAQKYNKDKVVLMPINPTHSFVYWEVTEQTLKNLNIDLGNIHLSFKLFDENHQEIMEFDSIFSIGDYYISHKSKFKALYIKLFIQINNELKFILQSNIIGVLQNTIKSSSSNQLLNGCIDGDLIYNSSLLGVQK
ncbi:MAG: DUF4912 domain-containing protein [Arcobacteraceae bacterium]|nr:DUF4912 domain-containing protein [Arcobacteraceae bacterium]MDY0328002.1 DUF4912 domain-containing protein [Arcobacteraceae bacterium]